MSIRLGIESMVWSIISDEKFVTVLLTLVQNCEYVSLLSFFSSASFSSYFPINIYIYIPKRERERVRCFVTHLYCVLLCSYAATQLKYKLCTQLKLLLLLLFIHGWGNLYNKLYLMFVALHLLKCDENLRKFPLVAT